MTKAKKQKLAFFIGTGAALGLLGAGYFFRHRLMAYTGAVWDTYTEERLKGLSDALNVRQRAKRFILDLQSRGINVRIPPDGADRSFAEQTELWKKGRFYPPYGETVTNAQAGESYHNYGLAFDIVPIVDGKAMYDTSHWPLIGKVGKSYGFKWGGDWSRPDKPHFEEIRLGTVWDLLAQYKDGTLTAELTV